VARAHQASGGRPVHRSEQLGSSQEFAMSGRCRRHAFALVFLAMFGLLFFVAPAGV
jgi:hypothetical protein